MDVWDKKETKELFDSLGILTPVELEARHEIELENYILKIQIEARVMGDMAKNHIMPAALQYQNVLIKNVQGLIDILGAEEGKLAGTQDKVLWNARIKKRQEGYLTPFVIRPLVDRLMLLGVLPSVENYFVSWPDMYAPSDKDKADVANIRTEALAKYVQGDVETLVPPREFLTIILEMKDAEVETIQKAAEEHQDVLDEKKEEEIQQQLRMDRKQIEETKPIKPSEGTV